MAQISQDPSLPTTLGPLSYVNIFVDDFIGTAQQSSNCDRVRQTLLHTINDVFRPLSPDDSTTCSEPVSLKKLPVGDCLWSTVNNVLGRIIDTVHLTIQLPPHCIDRLMQILADIPTSQQRTSIKNGTQYA